MLHLSICIITVVVLLNLVGLIVRPSEEVGTYLPGAYVLVSVWHAVWDRLSKESRERDLRYYDEVYVGEKPETARLIREMKYAGAALIIMFFSAVLYLVLEFGGIFESEKIDSLKRPENSGVEYKLVAEYENKDYELSLFLEPVHPDEERIEAMLDRVGEEIWDYVLWENEDEDRVTKKLRFPQHFLSEQVRIYWTFSDTELVTSDGRVASERLYKKAEVNITAHVSYYEGSRDFNCRFTICPASEESRNLAGIEQKTADLAGNDYEKEVELPDSFEGESLSFSIKKDDNSVLIFGLGVFAALLMLPYGLQNKKKKLKERNDQLICDYPELVSKLSLLLSSGLGIRVAFCRIVSDYEKRKMRQNIALRHSIISGRTKKSRKDDRRYLYEEMIRTRNEMALGVSETEAYENFGRRCKNMYYIRLASLLCRNVKKGAESIIPALRQEINEAARERQARIRKKGEETGMKLLLPMAGMFALILAVILVPAFMTI